MLRTFSLLLLIATVGYSQWRDSSRVLVPAPSGKAVKVTQFAIGDTNSWKVSGALAYIGGNFYIANGTYYVLMAGSGTSSADTATFVTKGTTQVVSGTKYFTAPQYFRKTVHAGIDSFFLRGDTSSVVTIGYVTGPGTVAIASGDTIVYGSGTSFLSTFIVGQTIFINDLSAPEAYTISSIQSDTQLGISTPHLGDGGSGFEYQYIDTVTSLYYPAYFKYYNGTLISVGDTSFMPVRDKTKNGFLWFPRRGALRSGYASGAQWDSSSLGLYSASFGYNNTVSNQYSFSSGSSNTVSGNSSSSFGSSNTVAGDYSILGGQNLSSASVPYVNLFGGNLHATKQTLGGFGYANSPDTVYFGHATVSLGVPLVAANFAKPLSGGEELGAFAMFADGVRDTSSYVFQQYAGVAGVGGTQTSSFTFEKNFGTASVNFDKWDGSRKVRYIYIDTANGVFLNQQITEVGQNFGDWTLSNKNFIVDAGYLDADSLRLGGTTRMTSGAYHSGLGGSSFGNISTGSVNSNGNSITGGAGSFSTGTFSSTITQTGNATGNILVNNSTGSPIVANVYSTSATTQPQIQFNRARGTSNTSYNAVNSGDVLGGMFASGSVNTTTFSGSVGAVRVLAKENFSTTANGTYIDFATTQNGATSRTVDMVLDKDNSLPRLTVGTTAGTGTGNLYIDSLYFGTTLSIDANRKYANVGGIATTGAHGVAPIVDTATYAGVASSIAAKNLTSTVGLYRITYYLATTTAGTGGSVLATLSYNNGAAQTVTSASVSLATTAGAIAQDVVTYYVASGTPTISTTVTGATGSPVYRFDAIVERIK